MHCHIFQDKCIRFGRAFRGLPWEQRLAKKCRLAYKKMAMDAKEMIPQLGGYLAYILVTRTITRTKKKRSPPVMKYF